MNKILVSLILFLIVGAILALGYWNGMRIAESYYNERCMKYFGNKGYPADYYCKLFIGDIKARDEQ